MKQNTIIQMQNELVQSLRNQAGSQEKCDDNILLHI